eukprot:jgi/Ulvmu1/463/UM001_0470.1
MSVSEIESIADVICAAVACGPWGALVLAGVGSRLKGFHVDSGTQVLSAGVLQGCRIHGVVVSQHNDNKTGAILAVYGNKQLALLQLQAHPSPAGTPVVSVLKLAHTTQLPHWVLQAEITACMHHSSHTSGVPRSASAADASAADASAADASAAEAAALPASCQVVLGLTDNSVELWTFAAPRQADGTSCSCDDNAAERLPWEGTCEDRSECDRRQLLYSIRLAVIPDSPDSAGSCCTPGGASQSHAVRLAVASGTIFHDILLWAAKLSAASTGPGCRRPRTVTPLRTLRGHAGSILRLQWAASLRLLLSAADDRTARVWRMPHAWWRGSAPSADTPAHAAGEAQPVMTLWGHAARVWDVACMGTVLLTAAEDGDVRIWHGSTGAPLATVRAHQGRGAWCLCALSDRSIASGGGDCALKVWRLPEWLPPAHAELLLRTLCADDVCQLPAAAADSAEAGMLPGGAGSPAVHVTTCMPPALAARGGHAARVHSTSSESLCALALASLDRLYAATSVGRLLQIDLRPVSGAPEWREVCDVASGGMHLACCAAQPMHACGSCTQDNTLATRPADVVVCGSRQGTVTVVSVALDAPDESAVLARWCAAPASSVLSVYVPDALPTGHVLCARADGRLWWLHVPALRCARRAAHSTETGDAMEAAECDNGVCGATICGWAMVSAKNRISAVEVLPADGLMIVGDSVGGLTGFTVPSALMHARTAEEVADALSDAGRGPSAAPSTAAREFGAAWRFGKRHGTHPVTMVAAAAGGVYTGGRDGVVCKWTVSDAEAAYGAAGMHCVEQLRVPGLSGVVGIARTEAHSTQHRETLLAGFRSSEFRLWDSERDVEHLAVQCGGWRRPFALRLHSSHRYTAALLKEQSIRVVRRVPAAAAPKPPVDTTGAGERAEAEAQHEATSLLRGHHGRIVLACECLSLGAHHVAAVSASEDGTVRALIFRREEVAPHSLQLADTLLLGKHITGAAVRCLSAAQMHGGGGALWLLVSGGAREVQTAWMLTPRPPRAGGDPPTATAACTAQWLATRPPAVGVRPKRNPQFSAVQAQERTLSLAAAACPSRPTACAVLEAPSGGGIRLSVFDTAAHAWTPAATLCYHRFVVLSLATACIAGRVMVCSGGSDGCMALWDITDALEETEEIAAGGVSRGGELNASLREVRPVVELPAQHQSGVNTVKLAAVGGMLCAVSGGDDQLLRVTVLQRGTTHAWAAVGAVDVPCAHASALKGLCLRRVLGEGGRALLQCCSVGWDQFVRVWQIDVREAGGGNCATEYEAEAGAGCLLRAGVGVREVLRHAVDASEPAGVAGCTMSDGRWHIFVAGRGSQMLTLRVPLL